MSGIQHDMSIASYGLLAAFAISHQVFGLRVALLAGFALAGVWVLGTLLVYFVMQWRRNRLSLPAQTGGAEQASIR